MEREPRAKVERKKEQRGGPPGPRVSGCARVWVRACARSGAERCSAARPVASRGAPRRDRPGSAGFGPAPRRHFTSARGGGHRGAARDREPRWSGPPAAPGPVTPCLFPGGADSPPDPGRCALSDGPSPLTPALPRGRRCWGQQDLPGLPCLDPSRGKACLASAFAFFHLAVFQPPLVLPRRLPPSLPSRPVFPFSSLLSVFWGFFCLFFLGGGGWFWFVFVVFFREVIFRFNHLKMPSSPFY